jgi:competence protein ComGC
MVLPLKRLYGNEKGFTLIEIITSLIIIMIISVIAGMGLIEISRGYIFSKKNSIIAQQGQIAMMRIKKELSNIKSVASTPTATSITFTRNSDGTSHTISWASGNSPLLIDTDTLVVPVSAFSLAYYNSYDSNASSYSSSTSIIEITLQLVSAENTAIEYKDRVNLYLETGG